MARWGMRYIVYCTYPVGDKVAGGGNSTLPPWGEVQLMTRRCSISSSQTTVSSSALGDTTPSGHAHTNRKVSWAEVEGTKRASHTLTNPLSSPAALFLLVLGSSLDVCKISLCVRTDYIIK